MWQLTEESLSVEALGVQESLFTIGNGYLGMRGYLEEGTTIETGSVRGSYINGVYARVPMRYGERAVGFTDQADKQPRIMETQSVVLCLDGERVYLDAPGVSQYKRVLDFKSGTLKKSYTYTTQTGKIARIQSMKLIAFAEPNLCLQQWSVEFPGAIELTTVLDGNVQNYVNVNDPRVAQGHAKLLETKVSRSDLDCLYLLSEVSTSGIQIACGAVETLANPKQVHAIVTETEHGLFKQYKASNKLKLDRYVYVADSRLADVSAPTVSRELHRLRTIGVEAILKTQISYLEKFWEHSDIEIFGNDHLQQAIRFNLFQLLQSVGKDGFSNLSAKGLSGEGYEGHYFWDTEIYALPLLSLTQPEIAKNLLTFRWNQLPEAKAEAEGMGHEKGVKFPWRTISGIESSGYFPAGTAQYHINSDIAYGVIKYYQLTGDEKFLRTLGLDMLVETSRFWLSVGQWVAGKFCINCVTGPDEYTALVDNNFYTNAMAQHQLLWLSDYLKKLEKKAPKSFETICERLKMTPTELSDFEQAGICMNLPRSAELGIDLQDDQFLNRAPWPFETVSQDKYPLLLHYHPLIIYRHQVLKQADTVLAHLMLPSVSDRETMKRSFNYYEALTTHDSSLSSCVYGTMAARLGEKEKAWQYFMESVDIDLSNTHGNTKDGLHMANIAGSCLTIIQGFAGLNVSENGLSLSAWVPEAMDGYRFKVLYKGTLVTITAQKELPVQIAYEQGKEIPVHIIENEK